MESYKEFQLPPGQFPSVCCKGHNICSATTAYTQGCYQALENMVYMRYSAVVLVANSMALVFVVSLVIGFYWLKRFNNQSTDEIVEIS
jgi:hypothetical protein